MRNPTWQDQDRARGHWCVYYDSYSVYLQLKITSKNYLKLYLQVDNDDN